MRNEFDRDSGVTYIGPRSFVAGFAVLCSVFVAIVYGSSRIAESLEAPVPMSASAGLAVTPATSSPAVVSALASPSPAVGQTPGPLFPSPLPSLQSAVAARIVSVPSTHRVSAAHPPSTRPVSVAHPPSTRPVTVARLPSTRPVAWLHATPEVRAMARSTPTPAPTSTPTRLGSFASLSRTSKATSPRVAQAALLRLHRPPARLSRAAPKSGLANASPGPRPPQPALLLARSERITRTPSGLLVPFKTAAALPSAGLEPQAAGRATLVVSPAAKP